MRPQVLVGRPDPTACRVADLDRAVARSACEEDFVTAAIVEERGGTLTVLNCGHPGPLLLRQGRVIPLDPPRTAPPLGLSPAVDEKTRTLLIEAEIPNEDGRLRPGAFASAKRSGCRWKTSARA